VTNPKPYWNSSGLIQPQKLVGADPEPVRDVELSLQALREEVNLLESALADLVNRLSKITKSSSTTDPLPDYAGETILGSEISSIANQVSDMKRVVRHLVYSVGV